MAHSFCNMRKFCDTKTGATRGWDELCRDFSLKLTTLLRQRQLVTNTITIILGGMAPLTGVRGIPETRHVGQTHKAGVC